MAHVGKRKRNKRVHVMAGAGGRRSPPHPPPVKHNDRGWVGGCQCSRLKQKAERRMSTEARSKMESSKSWENKEGINETHQHNRAITDDVGISKILEVSN